MKRGGKTAALLALSLLLMLLAAACGGKDTPESTASSPKETAGPTEEKTEGTAAEDPVPAADDPYEAMIGKTFRELGAEVIQQAVVEAGLALNEKNPYVQYQYTMPLTAQVDMGPEMETAFWTPEMVAADTPYYANCRCMGGDILYNALGVKLGCSRQNWMPNSTHQDMLLLTFRSAAAASQSAAVDNKTVFDDKEKFLETLLPMLEPGDILYIWKGGFYHVEVVLGDCFGDGQDWLVHCYPVNGGSSNCWPRGSTNQSASNPVTVDNFLVKDPLEPRGACILQTVADCVTNPNASPNYRVNDPACTEAYLLRPAQGKAVLDAVIPEDTVTRLKYRRLDQVKSFTVDGTPYFVSQALPTGSEVKVSLTLTNNGKENYSGMSVTELIPEGTTLVEGSVNRDGAVKDGKISWTVDIKAGKSAILYYTVKIDAPAGSVLSFPAGAVEHIATRSAEFRVGKGGLNAQQLALLNRVAEEEQLPEALVQKTEFMDLGVFAGFYREALGIEVEMPATAEELLDTLFVQKKKYDSEGGTVYMLQPKPELTAAEQAIDGLRVIRSTTGYFVFLEDMLGVSDRAIDLNEKFYEPGDCFLVLDTHRNPKETLDTDKAYYYLYLGNGKVLRYTKDGFSVTDYDKTIRRHFMADTLICLRPTQTADPAVKLPEGKWGPLQRQVNLALGAKVTTSYELVDGKALPLDMINNGKTAIDGTNMAALKFSKDGEILFDLGQVQEVSGYRIWNYEWPMEYGMATAWKVYGSEDGKEYTLLDDVKLDTSSFAAFTQYASVVRDGEPDGGSFAAPVKARYIKLTVEECIQGSYCSEAHIRMYEVEILGRKAEPVNLAPKAAVNSTYPIILADTYQPYLINDGSEAAGLTDCAGWYFRDNCEILFTLEKESTLTGYKLLNMNEPEIYGGVKAWKVLISADGENWTEVDDGTDLSKTPASRTLETPMTAKYVKLVVLDSHCNTKLADTVADKRVIRIAEFEIFGY